jgi:hypothetical protein
MLRARKRSGPGKLFIWLAASLWRNSRPKECSHSSGDTGSSKAASTIVWTSLCARMRAGFGHPRPREYWERYGVWWSAWPTLRSIVRDRKTPSPNAPPAHSRVGSNLREADANASTRSSSPNTPTFWSYETEKTRPNGSNGSKNSVLHPGCPGCFIANRLQVEDGGFDELSTSVFSRTTPPKNP